MESNNSEESTVVEEPSVVENQIDPAISESFIKELFIENKNIEMIDIKENTIENPIVENPIIDNPVLDEIQITIEKSVEPEPIVAVNYLDQDTLQRLSVGVQFLLEMYRVITSSLLILFVPQICVDHICTTTENLVWETNTYNTALCFNFISMAFLVNMYYLELVRENRLIKYLAVNPELANDNNGVGKQLELLHVNKQNKIFSINRYYRLSSYGALSIYVLNVMLSAAAVNKYYAGSQTVSTFVTYVLFMATKFASVYSLISTEKNIFYSAYLKSNIQFNDIDVDNKITK
jgi:hypothetical protein